MPAIAEQVQTWQRDARAVSIVRVITTAGFSSRERAALAAFTPDEPVAGRIFSGALDPQLRAQLAATPQLRAVLDLRVGDDEAAAAGLSCGGSARLLVQPARDIDADGWATLASGAPACLITTYDTDPGGAVTIGSSEVFTSETIDAAEQRYGPGVRRIFTRGTDQTAVLEVGPTVRVITALWPVPRMVVVGGGLIAAALVAAAGLHDWTASVVDSADGATDAIVGLTRADAVVVLSHDEAVAGPALVAALTAATGYIGGLGSAHTQNERASWLREHGQSDPAIARIHGPAGLDIGAFTPAEIATAIVAEIIAVRSGASGGSLQGRSGPIRPA